MPYINPSIHSFLHSHAPNQSRPQSQMHAIRQNPFKLQDSRLRLNSQRPRTQKPAALDTHNPIFHPGSAPRDAVDPHVAALRRRPGRLHYLLVLALHIPFRDI